MVDTSELIHNLYRREEEKQIMSILNNPLPKMLENNPKSGEVITFVKYQKEGD